MTEPNKSLTMKRACESRANIGANGYRFYEDPQLLILQQILFYRELGFGLKQIHPILGPADSRESRRAPKSPHA